MLVHSVFSYHFLFCKSVLNAKCHCVNRAHCCGVLTSNLPFTKPKENRKQNNFNGKPQQFILSGVEPLLHYSTCFEPTAFKSFVKRRSSTFSTMFQLKDFGF